MPKTARADGRYSVSGPGIEREGFSAAGAATAWAQAAALDAQAEELTLYVRDSDGRALAHVVKVRRGAVETYRVHTNGRGEARP